MNRVVITGIGWVTPMGHSIEEVWQRLLRGESGISRTTLFDASTFPTSISAEVKNFRLFDHIPQSDIHSGAGRNTQAPWMQAMSSPQSVSSAQPGRHRFAAVPPPHATSRASSLEQVAPMNR